MDPLKPFMLRFTARACISLATGALIACGGGREGPSDSDADDGAADAQSSEPSEVDEDHNSTDASEQTDAAPALSETDASAPNEGGGSGDPSAITIPVERMQTVAKSFCQIAFQCEAAMSREVFATESRCAEQMQGFWQDDLEQIGIVCVNAALVEYACYASHSCAEQYTGCTMEADRSAAFCASEE